MTTALPSPITGQPVPRTWRRRGGSTGVLVLLVSSLAYGQDAGTPDVPVMVELKLGMPAPADGYFLDREATRRAGQALVDAQKERDERVTVAVVVVSVGAALLGGAFGGFLVGRAVK